MTQTKRKGNQQLQVLTNQLHIELPTDWSPLLQEFSIWRYRLSDSQNQYRLNHKRKDIFYSTFTNAYKDQVDQPFYYFTFDEREPGVYRPALYTLLPVGHSPKPWTYTFGDPANTPTEKIAVEQVEPDELSGRKAHIMLKLMLALSFYKSGLREQQRRVCQSQFYLRVKSNTTGKRVIAVEIQPKVDTDGDVHTLTIKVEANTFTKINSAKVGRPELGTYYELFTSQGHGYLRQLRPSQVADFAGDVYKQITDSGQKTQADWHHNGSKKDPDKYKESRSRQVYHVQERLRDFLQGYGFQVTLTEEPMQRLWPGKSELPLERLPTIQVIDNRLNKDHVPTAEYLDWLNSHSFKSGKHSHFLSFELIEQAAADPERPLLVLTDAEKEAFIKDRQPGMLAQHGYQDPYHTLYDLLPQVVKQTLNVNTNPVEKFTQPDDYLDYDFPNPAPAPVANAAEGEIAESDDARKARVSAIKKRKNLDLKLDVCLSELWLKWVIAGKPEEAPVASLPLLAGLSDEWGFLHRDTLLYFEQGQLRFAEALDCRKMLKERFTPWSKIKEQFMARQPKYANAKNVQDQKVEDELRNSHFILVGQEAFELERTEAIAMPNWPVLNAIRELDPLASEGVKSFDAIGVYAAGIWYSEATSRYVVGGAQSSNAAETRGHHVYQIHRYNPDATTATPITVILSFLAVTFVRRNQYTVLPYPFDLVRLHKEVLKLADAL